MGFFGEVIDAENSFQTEVPNGYMLTVTSACLDPSVATGKGKLTVLKVITANTEGNIILCVLNGEKGLYQAPLSAEFGPEDSPITFYIEGEGNIHISGSWSWKDDECSDDENGEHCHGDSDSEAACEECNGSDGEEGNETEDEEDEAPTLVPVPVPVEVRKSGKKRDRAASTDSTASKSTGKNSGKNEVVAESIADAKTDKNAKKTKIDKSSAAMDVIQENKDEETEQKSEKKTGNQLKKWRVKPQNDEGILVLDPKTLKKPSGVTITDYVIGNGVEPKPGAKVKIVYEGMYPDGTIFDSSLKRTKPFVFRKGTGQVIKGLDRGIEGMFIGGSREIIVPSELGYGEEGIGNIPGNQTLVFRVTLIGQNK